MGRANRRTGTKPEMRLRSALHSEGLRYRRDLLIRSGEVRTKPDIVFTRLKVAVFVDGCFWHGCPLHQVIPKSNREYWVPKLESNVRRDRRVDAALAEDGWRVVRIWEHVPLDEAVSIVHQELRVAKDPRASRPKEDER